MSVIKNMVHVTKEGETYSEVPLSGMKEMRNVTMKKTILQELPIPTHLKEYLKPVGVKNDEFHVEGNIQCLCGNNSFKVCSSNNGNITQLTCSFCGKDKVLFDAGKHGYDGFVCKDDFLDKTEPLIQYVCRKCRNTDFLVDVSISSQGKADFLEEVVNGDDSFKPEDWVDGFEWITTSLKCNECGTKHRNFIDAETM